MSVSMDIIPIYGHLADDLNLPKYKMSLNTDIVPIYRKFILYFNIDN